MHPQTLTQNAIKHFSIKGALAPITIFEVLSDDIESMNKALKLNMQQAPLLLKNAPTVIDFSRLPEFSDINISQLLNMLAFRGLSAVGFRSTQNKWSEMAKQAGLVEFPTRKPQIVKKESQVATPIQTHNRKPTVVTQPIRSGQRIVAAESDLIIMNSVSAGAEVLSAGNIHIYGTLRGRALAGIHGNDQSQIFCKQMEAELLAIAGQYKLCDEIDSQYIKSQAHVYLSEGRLIIEALA